MHELGIIVQMVKTLDAFAVQEKIAKIAKVHLEIGEVSGIIPSYFSECWEFYRKKNDRINNCELLIHLVEGVSLCRSCNKVYETKKYAKICPFCQSEETHLLQGDQCTIRSIEVPDEPLDNSGPDQSEEDIRREKTGEKG